MIDAGSGRGMDPIGPTVAMTDTTAGSGQTLTKDRTAAAIARGETTGAEIAIGMTPEPGEMIGAGIGAIRSTGTTDSARASMIGAVHAVMNVERSAMPVGQRGISTGAGIATGGMVAAMGETDGIHAVSTDTTIRWTIFPGGATALTGTMIGTDGIVTGTTIGIMIGSTIAFSQ